LGKKREKEEGCARAALCLNFPPISLRKNQIKRRKKKGKKGVGEVGSKKKEKKNDGNPARKG